MIDEELQEIIGRLVPAFPTAEVIRNKNNKIMIRILDTSFTAKRSGKITRRFAKAMDRVPLTIYPKIATVILASPHTVNETLNTLFDEAKHASHN